ncbi:MAG: NUDIX hydrolase [Bacteroidota bacterium]
MSTPSTNTLPAGSNPWTPVSAKKVYDTPWISVHHHEVLNALGDPTTYGTVHYKNLAIGIIPLDAEGNTWIVGQHRFPLNQYSWEIPEGGGHPDTEPVVSAQRELREETGIIARDWQLVLEMHTSNSVCDEQAFIYVARDLEFHPAAPDDDEVLEVRKVPFDEVFGWVMAGAMTDSLTVAGVLKVKHLLDQGAL